MDYRSRRRAAPRTVVALVGLSSCIVGNSAQLPAAPATSNAEFVSHCASCHGSQLAGGQHAPPLSGAGFRSNWLGKPARTLYSRIISTMPQDNPGTLTPSQALSITLFLFDVNGISLGEKPIASANDLNSITITAPTTAP